MNIHNRYQNIFDLSNESPKGRAVLSSPSDYTDDIQSSTLFLSMWSSALTSDYQAALIPFLANDEAFAFQDDYFQSRCLCRVSKQVAIDRRLRYGLSDIKLFNEHFYVFMVLATVVKVSDEMPSLEQHNSQLCSAVLCKSWHKQKCKESMKKLWFNSCWIRTLRITIMIRPVVQSQSP